MSTSAHASLIEMLRNHMNAEEYSPSVQRCYPTLARHFLDYCDGAAVAVEAVREAQITKFLQMQYQLFTKRHGQSPPFQKWSRRHTGAVRMLLRLVHGRWPVAAPPANALEEFHRDVVQDYETWLRDLRGLHSETRTKRTTQAMRFLVSLGTLAAPENLARLSVCDIDAYVKQCCLGLRRSSIEDRTVCLRDFLRHLYRSGQTTFDLGDTVIGPRIYDHEAIPSALRAEEVRRVLELTREDISPVGLRDYAILMLLATYGLRAAEIIQLRLDDIDWRRDVLGVRHSKTGTYTELRSCATRHNQSLCASQFGDQAKGPRTD